MRPDDNFLSQDEMAEKLKMNARTLRRHLKKLGTSYKEILNSARQSIAISYLEQSNHTIEEIAYLLGYSEPGNFIRAFKSWTGYSPRGFRHR